MRLAVCLLVLPAGLFAQTTAVDDLKLVPIESIGVKGTRLTAASVIMLTGLKPGQSVNALIVNKACQRLTATGLIKRVDFDYETVEGKNSVALELKLADELPLYPGHIQVTGFEEQDVWTWLASLDPLFTRELPITDAALRFYAANIGKVLAARKPEIATDWRVVADVRADKHGNPGEVWFRLVKLKEAAGVGKKR